MIFAQDILSDLIIPLNSKDTGITALHFFDEFKVNHLPVVDGDVYLGLVSEDDIFVLENFETPLSFFTSKFQQIFINIHETIHNILAQFVDYKLTVLPVLDDNQRYVGSICQGQLLQSVSHMLSVKEVGGVFSLEVDMHTYSMSDIVKTVEKHNSSILNFSLIPTTNPNVKEAVVKLNTKDISPILEDFSLQHYNIKTSAFESEYYDNLKDRYNQLINYLNI